MPPSPSVDNSENSGDGKGDNNLQNGVSTSTTVSDPSTVLPLRMTSVVVKGYGRGSKDLGIPTANLDRDAGHFSTESFEDLPTGIYWGFCRIGEDSHIYKTA
jgi:Riboflavin kinase